VRDAAQKQQGRHVSAVDTHSEVQTEFCTVTGLNRADDFAARDNLARRQRRENRFIARQDAAGVSDRQHILVDDKAGEVHDAIRRRVDGAARGDIDATVSGGVGRRGSDERPQDLMRPAHWPGPAGLGCGGCRPGREAGEHQTEHQRETKRETKHPLIVASGDSGRRARRREGHNLPKCGRWGSGATLIEASGAIRVTTRVRSFI
jgi:hypothetical protein